MRDKNYITRGYFSTGFTKKEIRLLLGESTSFYYKHEGIEKSFQDTGPLQKKSPDPQGVNLFWQMQRLLRQKYC